MIKILKIFTRQNYFLNFIIIFYANFAFTGDDLKIETRIFKKETGNLWYLEVDVTSSKTNGVFLLINSIGFDVSKLDDPILLESFSFQFKEDPLIVFIGKNSSQFLEKGKLKIFSRKVFPLPEELGGKIKNYFETEVKKINISASCEVFFEFKKKEKFDIISVANVSDLKKVAK